MTDIRFSKFGMTIHPQGGENIDWLNLSKDEISAKLKELNFIKPIDLIRLLLEARFYRETKTNKETGQKEDYFSEVKNVGGQLELGLTNNRPHYQLWMELSSKATKTKVLKYFSEKIYQVERSPAISVIVLTEEIGSYQAYCIKENRANLTGDYEHISIDKKLGELEKYLEDNPEAKKFLKILILTKDG